MKNVGPGDLARAKSWTAGKRGYPPLHNIGGRAGDGSQQSRPSLLERLRSRLALALAAFAAAALADGLLVNLTAKSPKVIVLDAATGAVLWQTQKPLDHPFASNPYIPPTDTEPVLASGTLIYFHVEDLIALQVP